MRTVDCAIKAEFAMPFIASDLALFLTSEFENVQWETSHMSQAMFGVSQYIFPAPSDLRGFE